VGYGKLVADRGFEVQRFRGSGLRVKGWKNGMLEGWKSGWDEE